MESKTSFFNKTIFLKTLKRFFPWCICYSLIMLVVVPVLNITQAHYYNSLAVYERYSSALYETYDISQIIVWFIFIAAILSAVLIYSFLYKENAVSMFHSLPAKRGSLLFTNFLAGMTLLVIPLVLAQVGGIITLLFMGLSKLTIVYLKLLAAYIVLTFIFYSIATFSAILAGNALAVPIIYGIINIFAYGVIVFIDSMTNFFLFGVYNISEASIVWLSPIGYLYENFCTIVHEVTSHAAIDINVTVLAAYSGFAIVLLLISWILYKKRALECAGDVLAFKKTAWFFQIIFAVTTGLIGTAIVYEMIRHENINSIPLFIAFVFSSTIGFFGGRMLIRKRFRIFKESLSGFCIFALCSLAIMICFEIDICGFETKIPDNSEVAQVEAEYYGYFDEEELIKKSISLHKQIVQNKKFIEDHVNDPDYHTEWININYTLKNGKTLSRSYEIPFKSEQLNDITTMIYKYYDICNDPIVVQTQYLRENIKPSDLLRMNFVDENEISQEIPTEDALRIVEAIQKDIDEGNVLNKTYSPWDEQDDISGNSPYYAKNHSPSAQYLELFLFTNTSDEDTIIYGAMNDSYEYEYDEYGKYGEYSDYRYIHLKETMVHTIKVLEELKYVTLENPLIYEEGYGTINFEGTYYE